MAAKEGKYMYCIIESDQSRSFGHMGIGGRRDELHTICYQDIAAVVSDSPIVKYRVSRENAIPHEQAIEEVMKTHAVLPVSFGTIADDEGKVKRILEKEYKRFKDSLDKMKGMKELGLKAMFIEDVIYEYILEKYKDIMLLKEKIATLPPEKTYYQRMKIGEMVEAALEKEKGIYREKILDTLSPLAVEVKTNNTYGERMIINAAFLVDCRKEEEFDREVRAFGEKDGDKIRFKYVGTLPPFNFVSIKIKMEEY